MDPDKISSGRYILFVSNKEDCILRALCGSDTSTSRNVIFMLPGDFDAVIKNVKINHEKKKGCKQKFSIPRDRNRENIASKKDSD